MNTPGKVKDIGHLKAGVFQRSVVVGAVQPLSTIPLLPAAHLICN